MKSKWFETQGKRILHIDLSNFRTDSLGVEKELTETVSTIGQEMYVQPLHSVLVLVDLTNTDISQHTNHLISERIHDTRKFVKRTAVVGLTGIRKIFLEYFAVLARSDTVGFETVEAAQAWLLKQ